jgi:hypothetical protein
MGFIWTGSEDYQRPFCAICYEVVADGGLKTTKLRQHFGNKNSDSACEIIQFFQKKLKEIAKCFRVHVQVVAI